MGRWGRAQLVFADVPLPALRHIFLTHQHSDHNADYGNLICLAWTAGLCTRIDTRGPPSLQKMTPTFLRDEQVPQHTTSHCKREAEYPYVPPVHTHELRKDGPVMNDDDVESRRHARGPSACCPGVRVLARRCRPVDRHLGDTAPSDNLVKLAQGADVLVHSVMYPPAVITSSLACQTHPLSRQVSSLTRHPPRIPAAWPKRLESQTLVLSHFVPPDNPEVTDQMWIDAARVHYRGSVIVGKGFA